MQKISYDKIFNNKTFFVKKILNGGMRVRYEQSVARFVYISTQKMTTSTRIGEITEIGFRIS
jgi:hypothetical protein